MLIPSQIYAVETYADAMVCARRRKGGWGCIGAEGGELSESYCYATDEPL